MKPNFIIGGVVAGGTSFLSSAITQHPEIYLPRITRPEPSFFYKTWEYKKGIEHYTSKYFHEVEKQHVAIGERSSLYLHGGEEVAKRIYNNLPDIKLIFIIKNPIERAYSNYRFSALEGLEDLGFEEAISTEKERTKALSDIWKEIKPYSYVERGFYYAQLERFYKYFKKEQILILKSEDLASNPYDNFIKVFDFISVSNNFKPKLPKNFTSLNVKNLSIQKQMRKYFNDRFYLIVEMIRKELDPMEYAKNNLDKEKILLLKSNLESNKFDMSTETRIILRDIYSKSNRKLKKYITFDTNNWV